MDFSGTSYGSPRPRSLTRENRRASLSSQLSNVTNYDDDSDQPEVTPSAETSQEASTNLGATIRPSGLTNDLASRSSIPPINTSLPLNTFPSSSPASGQPRSPSATSSPGTDRLSKRQSTLSNSPSEGSIAEDPLETLSSASFAASSDFRSSTTTAATTTTQQPISLPTSSALPPSHRLSSTPIFPSPLAQALFDDDSLDNFDIDEAALPGEVEDTLCKEEDDLESNTSCSSNAPLTRQTPHDPNAGHRRRSDAALGAPRWNQNTRRSPSQSLKERVLSPRSSVSSLSSGSTTSSMPSQGSANLAEVRSAVAAHRGSSSSVEYVPSASYAQSGSSSTTPGTSPPSAVGTDALSLRRSYHEKQHSDSARSLEHALMKASPSSSSPPPPTASISRKTSLSTSPSSHSRSTSASSPVHTPLTAALDANALSNVPNRPGLVTTATSPTLPVKAGASQSDAIRLQRVPTSVRIAQSLHPMLTPTTVSAASVSSTSHLTPVQHAEVSPLQTSPQPRTPLASRANTPSSDTSSSSLSAPASKTPSRHGSPAQDPKGTRLPPLHMTATPTTASATSSSHRTNSSPSASAYSPLFDIPTMASPARRARARTFSIPSAAVLREPSMRTSIENTGRPPPSQGLLLEFDAQPHQSPRETSAGSVSKQSHRLSAQPILHGTLPTEDEYARIIMQSRSAKMKKWKGTSKTGLDANTDFAPFHDNGGASSSLSAPRSGHVKRGNMAFDEDAPFQDPQEADIADQERGSDLLSDFGHHGDMTRHSSSTSASNVEWVDWLDEYRKMKEAKVLAESQNAGSVDDQSVIPGEAETPATVIANYAFPPPVASPAGRLHSQSNVDLTSNTPSLQRTTSHVEPGHHSMATVMQSDPPHQKRKRASGAFSRIDAWWGSVRNSFGGHSPSTSQNNVFRQAPSSTFALPEPMSPKTTASYQPRHLPQETEREAADKSAMPPPPIPLKKPKPTTSTSEPIVMQAKGALAPAARITTAAGRPPLGNRSISSQSFDSSASEEILPPQLPPIAKRRNLRLSLSLGTQRPPSNSDNSRPSSHSSTSSGQPQHGRPTPMQTPSAMPRPSIFGRETTPGLTPGHSPVWDKTPGLVPSRNTGVDASHPVRPPLGRGTSGATPSASFSILTVRQHIRHRLQTAKESCDRELRKIIQGITAYVDKELIKERASALDLASDSAVEPESDQEEAFGTSTAASASNSPGQRHASLSAVGPSQLFGSSPGSSSPLVRRKSSVAAKKGRSRRSEHTGTSPQRQHRKGERGYSGLAPQASDITAALNRSLSSRSNDSNPTSRSTSRSHSPLPGSEAPYRRASGHITPARLDTHEATPLVSTLQAVITIATEILDTSVASLIAKPGSCSEFIHRVQSIGKAWDENAWPCRGWYVQLLLAVAGLSRVVEWWEAEKGFWKFDDEPESGDNEPIVFYAKGSSHEDHHSRTVSGSSKFASRTLSESPLQLDAKSGQAPAGSSVHSAPPEEPTSAPAPEISQGKADDLANAVEEVRSATIMMELSLDGRRFHYLSPVWEDVVGLDPVECLGQPIADMLHPSDADLFAEATNQLLSDSSHTVEVRFRLKVYLEAESNDDDESNESNDEQDRTSVWEAMEGKGMCIHSRDSGEPSHTMWVLRPVDETSEETPHQQTPAKFGLRRHQRSLSDPNISLPFALPLRQEPLLCRICERDVPTWFFEKHNETCIETHRLEAQISESNEKLSDLLRVIEGLKAALDVTSTSPVPEYRSVLVQNTSNMLESHRSLLDNLHAHVSKARQISTPSPVEEDEEDQQTIPGTPQLLSPRSESALAEVFAWKPASSEDPALSQLSQDIVSLVREKTEGVGRMRNITIYAERIRQEWEERAVSYATTNQSGVSSGPSVPQPPASHSRRPSRSRQESSDMTGLGLESMELVDNPSASVSRSSSVLGSKLLEVGVAPEYSSFETPENDISTDFSRLSLVHHSLEPGAPGRRGTPSPLYRAVSPVLSPSASPLVLHQSLSTAGSHPVLPDAQPRSPSSVPKPPPLKHRTASIKDFEVIKPISKGAFGSVYLAKKKVTGDYYAIKVLRKSDMIAKNQVTNVKAERMIMMNQAASDFVVKLFWTFQTKEYLYLVMEYLNGGDCAALIKAMGALEEEWAKSYIAEVILGLEHLHQKGVVHRDLKPDNLLIDSRGHLKLTDFGLSKIGLLGRQSHVTSFTNNVTSSLPTAHSFSGPTSRTSTPSESGQKSSYFAALGAESTGQQKVEDQAVRSRPHALSVSSSVSGLSGGGDISLSGVAMNKAPKTAQGTPDYLSPESILGSVSGETVDWWALGVICYEFLYGIPPFHAETPDMVFENILSRNIDWYEDQVEVSPEARDFIERLLCMNPEQRLGAGGSQEVRTHPFLAGVVWNNLLSQDAVFVPRVTDPESTDYFDARGATDQVFDDEEVSPEKPASTEGKVQDPKVLSSLPALLRRDPLQKVASDSASVLTTSQPAAAPSDDFGTFSFKNVEVLKQANQDLIRKLRSEQQQAEPDDSQLRQHTVRSGSFSFKSGPLSPTESPSSSTSAPAFGSLLGPSPGHVRRPSEQPNLTRMRSPTLGEGGLSRRNSLPSRWQSPNTGEQEPSATLSRRNSGTISVESVSSVAPDTRHPSGSPATKRVSRPSLPSSPSTPKTVDVLVAEDNPISSKVIETILVRLGCRCVVVHNGEEVMRCTMGELVFDVIFLDLMMPILDGESAARMIRSTKNANQTTPIVAVTSYELSNFSPDDNNTIFSAVLTKPVQKADVLSVFHKLGFQAMRDAGQNTSKAVLQSSVSRSVKD